MGVDILKKHMIFLEELFYAFYDNPRLLIPIGAVGVWRWLVWIIKRVAGALYTPIKNDYCCSAALVTAVFRESPELFRAALTSWRENGPERIVVVVDSGDLDCIAIASEFSDVKVVVDVAGSKRQKMARGLDEVSEEIVIFADSDVVWTNGVLKKLMMPFVDPQVGGVSARPRAAPTNGKRLTVLERIADIFLSARYTTEVPATTYIGRAVSCLSGRTTAYRTDVVKRLRQPFLEEAFNGIVCVSGDDKRLTMLLLMEGYKTWHQLNAIVYTTFQPTLIGFTRQRLRWCRNSFRSDLRALFTKWLWRHPFLALVLVDKQVCVVTQFVGPIFLTILLWKAQWIAAIGMIIWWHLSRAVRVAGHLVFRGRDIVLIPLFVILTFYTGIIRVYALCTINRHAWLTR